MVPAVTFLLKYFSISATCDHVQKLEHKFTSYVRTQDRDNRETFLSQTTWGTASRTSKTVLTEHESLGVALLPNEVRQSISIDSCN